LQPRDRIAKVLFQLVNVAALHRFGALKILSPISQVFF
jgi:hypothetical protein